MDDIFSTLLNVVLELICGYIPLYFLSYLILIPGKNKIEVVTDESERKQAKTEIKKVRTMMCLVWTIIIVGFNLAISLL